MRAGLSTIQQTLTPEAAAVLNRSIAEAARRGHGQTTPLHVAATLLSSPSGLLRQACVRSHPTSSHPLQCRALELCFSVALDRLPTTANPTNPAAAAAEPPISNALMAALKRAQAHQRRGCPEQQQQPLLAVKVELEQLVVSILDDPSVSRVMREASFSSPAVKSTIEQSISIATAAPVPAAPPIIASRAPIARSLYLNPRLNPQQPAAAAGTDAARVLDIMLRSKKRNPVLVADADLAALMREVVEKIESGEAPPPLKSAQLIQVEKEFLADRSQIPAKIKEMSSFIQSKISESGVGVVLDLGDLKWLVESPGSAPIVMDTGRAVVAEIGKLVARFGDGAGVWIVGTATCATYLRCQVYHPTMENDWDIQAVPIAPRSKQPTLFQRLGGNGILSSSIESLNPSKGLTALGPPPWRPVLECSSSTPATQTLCSECTPSYERELASLVASEFQKSSSSESKPEARQSLPHWMQLPKPANDQLQPKEPEHLWKQRTEELLKRWRETCSLLHPKHGERRPALAFPGGYNAATFSPRPSFQPKLSHSTSTDRQDGLLRLATRRPTTPPGSPVRTDLVLGHSKGSDSTSDNAHRERIKEFAGCKQDHHSNKQSGRNADIADYDSFKRLFKGLSERVGWQAEAASAVATVVMQCKSGNGKLRGGAPKGDTWLLFTGSDKAGKRKMVAALSELMFGTEPTIIHLGGSQPSNADDGESNFRGKTSLDRIAEALRRNPFSVLLLEGIDRADMLIAGSIKRAIEKGRLADSQGREVSLGSAIFVLTADWVPEELKSSHDSLLRAEQRILNSTNKAWQLELSIGDNKSNKRGAEADCDKARPAKLRKELIDGGPNLSLDLNLAAGTEEETYEGSRNSSDLTVEHEQETVRLAISCPATLSPVTGLMELVDDTLVFKPVDFVPLRRKVVESISARFTQIMGNGRFILVEDDAVDRMVGAAWIAGAVTTGVFEDWIDRVLVPSMQQLKSNMRAGDGPAVVRLSAKSGRRAQSSGGDWLPATVTIAVGGV